MVVKGLYVTCREWNEIFADPPYTISEDARFVMGPSYQTTLYRPIIFDDFSRSTELLSNGLSLSYEDMYESIDLENPQGNDNSLKYFIFHETLVRLREDKPKDFGGVHTLMIVGKADNVLEAAEKLLLPHPFEKILYPYKKTFVDPSGSIDVLI